MDALLNLALALALGLLIGVERSWQTREDAEGTRIAGVRTFGLIGLLGGLWALLADELGAVLVGLAFAALTVALLIGYVTQLRTGQDQGLTTVVAALVTFALGALAVRGYQAIAAGAAVVTTGLLSVKPMLHGWIRRIEPVEFYGAIKLLLISVVMLPVLPNTGYGPWQALNPYELWWLVVLIAAISFAGYIAMKVLGPGRGTLVTGLFGGLASSTATTLHFARLGRDGRMTTVLAAGTLVASTTMFPRIVVEVTIVNPELVTAVLVPMSLLAITGTLGVFWLWHTAADREAIEAPVQNPFQLKPALQFGLLLAAVVLLTAATYHWFGQRGIYFAAAASGIADVDAITLSLSRMALDTLDHATAARAITLAALVNTLVKGVLVVTIAGRPLATKLAAPLLAVIATGIAAITLI